MVVGESINQAKDAAEAIKVEYQILEAEIDPIVNGQANAPQLWPNAENNEAFSAKKGVRSNEKKAKTSCFRHNEFLDGSFFK